MNNEETIDDLWQQLESATTKKKLCKRKKKLPTKCSFCGKRTKQLAHETSGKVNVYLCRKCKLILDVTRSKMKGADEQNEP